MISFEIDDINEMNGSLKAFLEYLESENVDADSVFDSRLVSCELISNVLKHCGEKVYFNGSLTCEEVIIAVRGGTPIGIISHPTLPDIFAESGRGLYIVNAVSGGNVRVQGDKVIVTIKRRNIF